MLKFCFILGDLLTIENTTEFPHLKIVRPGDCVASESDRETSLKRRP